MSQFKTLLLATDFTESSLEAAKTAVRLAQLFASEIHVVHVVEQLAGYENLEVGSDAVPPLLKVFVEDARSQLEVFCKNCPGPIPEARRHLRIGRPLEEILRAAEECGADLVIIGTHGSSGMSRVLLGSVAEKVISSAMIPVLSLRTALRLEEDIRVLVATDLSPSSREAARVADSLAQALHGTVTVLGVLEPPSRLAFWKMQPAEEVEQAEARLRGELEAFVADTLQPSTAREILVRVGDAREEVVTAAREIGADLVAMGVSGQSGSARWFVGKVARRVLQASPVPMLTDRAG